MPFDKTKSAGYLANHMARLFATELAQAIKPLGLAPAQFMALLELWETNELTQKQLVDRLDIEQATMANTLRRMERDGLILRRAHPKDRRAQVICLTVKAMQLEHPAKQAAMQVNQRALAQMNEPKKLLEMMQQVIEGLKQPPKE